MIRKFLLSLSAVTLLSWPATSGTSRPLAVKAHRDAPAASGVSHNPKHVAARTGNEFKSAEIKSLYRQPGQITSSHRFSIPTVNRAQASQAAGSSAPVRGAVLYSTNWNNIASYGLYEFPTDKTPGLATPIVLGEDWNANAGSVYAGRKYMAINKIEYYGESIVSGYVYNTETWQRENIIYLDQSFQALDMTYDPTTGNIYGAFIDSYRQSYTFGSFDIETGTYTLIRDLGRGTDSRWSAVACDAGGQLYAVSNTGSLMKVDKHSGDTQPVGQTGLNNRYLTSGAIDPQTGVFYYVVCNDNINDLYAIDTATAGVTRLYTLPGYEQVVGMYVDAPLAPDGALSEVTGLKLNFTDDSLTGTVSFKLPTTTFNGETSLGQAEWIIRVNGAEVATGTAACGTTVTETITVAGPGAYTVSVIARNDAGDSPVAKTDKWIGKDVPAAVTNLRLNYADGQFHLTWNHATAAHNAYFDPERVTYTVTRLPEGTVVASGISDNSFTEPIAMPESQVEFQYSVVADFEGMKSAVALSNVYPLGVIKPPYSETFDTADSLLPFTIIDANGDGAGWDWFSGQARMSFGRNSVDDWLILPVMKLKADNAYTIRFSARCYNPSYPERVALYAGTSPTPEAMTSAIIKPTVLNQLEAMQLSGIFVPESDGEYYFGIHGCSDPYQYYIYIDDLSVSAPVTAATPDRVGNLKAVAAPAGQLSATLTFTAPATDVAGRPLSSLDKVEIIRDGKVLETLACTPGEEVTYTDNSVGNGDHVYTAVAYSNSVKGLESSVSIFTGNDAPMPVRNFTLKAGNGNGDVVLTWDAVTADVRGTAIAPGKVTYTVTRFIGQSEKVIKTGMTECTLSDMPVDDDEDQMFVQYAIQPSLSGLTGEYSITEMYPVGMPYELPMTENFAGNGVGHIWAVGKSAEISTALWEIFHESEVELPSADGDGYYIGFTSGYSNDDAVFYSGKISIPSGAKDPRLTFYCYGIDDSENSFDIMVDSGSGFVSEFHFTAGGFEGWKRYSIDLAKYAGKIIRIAFNGVCGNYDITPFDDIRIAETPDHNLRVKAVSAPETARPNEKFMITATVENIGAKKASGYQAVLYRGAEAIATVEGPETASDATTPLTFTDTMSAAADGSQEYRVEIVYGADSDKSDNISATVAVAVEHYPYPAPTALAATESEKGVELSWRGPDFDNLPYVTETESFESYANLAYKGVGEWTLVDADGIPAGGINGMELEGIDGTAVPFFVMDGSEYDDSFGARTGSRSMCSMWVYGENVFQSDDWMISPELIGEAQTISFFARCYDPSYPETVEVLYSSTGKETDDFTSLSIHKVGEAVWKEIRAELPDGARYFAIRCVSNDCFMLFVDDVTFIPATAERMQLSLTGYNVYRNGVKITDTPLSAESFTDASPDEGLNTYVVTVVYGQGESAPSDAVSIGESGIKGITAGNVAITAGVNEIIVTGACGEPVKVTTPDGKLLASVTGSETTRIPAESGVYIVSAGRHVAKVQVR